MQHLIFCLECEVCVGKQVVISRGQIWSNLEGFTKDRTIEVQKKENFHAEKILVCMPMYEKEKQSRKKQEVWQTSTSFIAISMTNLLSLEPGLKGIANKCYFNRTDLPCKKRLDQHGVSNWKVYYWDHN